MRNSKGGRQGVAGDDGAVKKINCGEGALDKKE